MKGLHEFLVSPAETARRHGPHDRIVMSSRVRLARNLKDAAFPGWAKKPERVKILETIRPAVESLPEMKDAFSEAMDNLGALDKQIWSSAISSAANTPRKLPAAAWCLTATRHSA